MKPGLYIHIPFCKYICAYCDFGKKYIKNQPVDEYVDSLILELRLYDKLMVDTIYIGGGTPSVLNANQLKKIFSSVKTIITDSNIQEYTFEVNPDDINSQLLELLVENNVNRLSIGAQTLNDNILTEVKRNHTSKEVIDGYLLAKKYIENCSLDFMFNLPNQTEKDVDDVLRFITEHLPKHISFYGLILESNTILDTKNYKYWSEDFEARIYRKIQTKLISLGYENYEISNFALPGFRSIHNQKYWNGCEYYGIGLSASSLINNTRYTNTRSLTEYMTSLGKREFPRDEDEILDNNDKLYELIMLGLRTDNYIEIESELLTSLLLDFPYLEYLDISYNKIRIKHEYYYISNLIIIELLERI